MALFDYSSRLENAYQIITGSNPSFLHGYVANPSDEVFFQCLLNPGHDGTTAWLEYYLEVYWEQSTGGSQAISYKWQYYENGGSAWTDLVTGTVTTSAAASKTDNGVFTTGIALPARIRLIGTDTDATWRATVGDTYDIIMRAVGTIT